MSMHEPCRSETIELLDYAQMGGREGLLLYDETLYVEVAVVDDWLGRKAATASRGEAVRKLLMERIRQTAGD
jgi:hypothetical protein